MPVIDLYAPAIPENRNVWRLFPGSAYRFLPAFEAQGVGYLDIPGFIFPNGELGKAPDLLPRIAAAQHHYAQIVMGEQITINLSDFAKVRTSQKRGRLKAGIINFYETARTNDVVIMPEPSKAGYIRVGRFKSNDIVSANYSLQRPEPLINAREIEWIGRYRENTVSSALSASLRNQHPFTLLERSLYVEAFSLAYSSFIFGDRHVSTVFNKDDYLDADSTLLGLISKLSSAACYAMDNDLEGLGSADILSIFVDNPPIEYTCSHEIDIHSPGFNRYVSGKLVPLVISATLAAMISLGNCTAQEFHQEIDRLTVINTAPDADPLCNPPVHEATARILKLRNIDTTLRMCQNALEAKNRAGLKPSARAR